MMNQKFYITTPIYYGNGLPHVGHFYTSSIANVIYKYNKISGKNTRFTTGIDENSQKAVLKAQESGMDIIDYLDSMSTGHKEVWDYFKIDYTDFIRTTSERHHKLVKNVLQKCFDKGDIYEGEYHGMYCIGCESFKKDDDLVFMNKTTKETFPITDKVKESENIEKVCPDHLKTPDKIKEKNYFFRLTKYQTWIEEFYKNNPKFVNPYFRYNEVKAFVSRGLEDFSISRETNTFGISLPFDNSQVTYVWFDALFNYYTSCIYSRGGDKNNNNFIDESDFWIREKKEDSKILHCIGKDILRFHAIFWPAMLASYFDLGKEDKGILHFDKEKDFLYLPDEILTGGYFTVDGQKMSKSIGNVIEPVSYAKKYNKELLVLYMLSAFTIGRDGDYDRKDAILTYNSKLANNFGNLLNRAVVLTMKLDLEDGLSSDISDENNKLFILYKDEFVSKISNYNLKESLDVTFKFLDYLNNYVTTTEPWALMKDESKNEEVKEILYSICEGLRIVALNLYSFFPEKMTEVFNSLGLNNYSEKLENGEYQNLKDIKEVYNIKEKAPILFEKFDLE